MAELIDLTGLRFGRLRVVKRATSKGRRGARWHCACDCGGTSVVGASALRSGHTQSCGCLQRERTAAAARISSRIHGMTNSPEFRSWLAMLSRCRNPNATGYDRYGGRGIAVCERWDDFTLFYSDMGPRPSLTHSLDRIDKNGDYCPDNCRWATKEEQANNRRDNQIVIIDGAETTLRRALRQTGNIVDRKTAWRRIQRGWQHEQAITVPAKR